MSWIMIPKTIHYCRFWWEKPPLVVACIKSWEKFCPDWTIQEWNEKNCDLTINKRVTWAAKNKKRAFVADYFRLKALYDHGGVYIDADTNMLKNIDELVIHEAFIWFQKRHELSIWFLGSEKSNKDIKILLDYYDNNIFKEKTINEIVTDYFTSQGLVLNGKKQNTNNRDIYPSHYVSIDIEDGNAFVEDLHMNSWMPSIINQKPIIYLESLAARDDVFAAYFDEYIDQIKSSYQRKIWSKIIALLKFFKLDLVYLLIMRYKKK